MITEKRYMSDIVTLRQIELSDCTTTYIEWLNDPEITQYLETKWVAQNLDTVREFVDAQRKNNHSVLFAIMSKENFHIGNIKIGPVHVHYNHADISYFIGDKTYWNRGIASEAIRLICDFGFEELGLNKIEAGAYEMAVASWKALEKNGFRREGIFREQVYFENRYISVFRYGLLKSEWNLQRQGEEKIK